VIKVLIQVAAGSREKNYYNEKTLEYKETRHGSQLYPYPYGFIVGTATADGDAVDCYLITREKLKSGEIVECEPIGLLELDEDGEVDHKVLAIIPGHEIELSAGVLKELQEFIQALFSDYPDMTVRIGPLRSREAALHYIQESRDG
jgi:Inorganic pyrophosphatase